MAERRRQTNSKYTRKSKNSENELKSSGGYNENNSRQTGLVEMDYSKPVVVNDELVFEIFKFASRGFPPTKIAGEIGMSLDKLKKLRSENEIVDKAFLQGQEAAIEIVEHSLFQKANGYWTDVQEIKQNTSGVITKAWKKKWIDKDIRAIQYFLAHNKPSKWSQRAVEGSGRNSIEFKKTNQINFSGVDMSDKDQLRKSLEKFLNE